MELEEYRWLGKDKKTVNSVVARKDLGGVNSYWDTIDKMVNTRPDLNVHYYRYWQVDLGGKNKEDDYYPYLITSKQ